MSVAKLGCELPPGFRFHPTDEELIMCYLRNRADSTSCYVSIISEVDIYKFDPWQLPEKAEFGEREWYFFTPRDRKYPNGLRPNRAAVSGYWKATGTDKAIYSATKSVGVKKSLVFYKGRPPKGTKTDWIMHEYRLTDSRGRTQTLSGSMKLDDWVLCRVYKKRQMGNKFSDHSPTQTQTENQPDSRHLDQIVQLPCGGSYNPTLGYPKNEETSYISNDEDGPYTSWFPYHFADPRIGSLNSIALNQTMSVNPNFDI